MPHVTELEPSPSGAARPPASTGPGPDPVGGRPGLALLLGPLVFVALLLLPAPDGMSPDAWRTTAVAVLLAVWWVTEAIPLAATALIPLVLFPLLGVLTVPAAAAPYANPTIFLFLGGFVMALAMERWGLHRRLAFAVVRSVGVRPQRVVLGVMLATAFLSLWVSNTATTMMMLPIGLSVVHLVLPDGAAAGDSRTVNFGTCMMLGIAYAATIGGLGTLIGTPPNALLAGFVSETYDIRLGFGQWMLIGVPLVVIMLPLCWLYLTRLALPFDIAEIPGGRETIDQEYRKLGPIGRAERWVIVISSSAAILWVTRPLLDELLPGLDDSVISIAAALLLFAIPVDRRCSDFVMTWDFAERRIPWGVLVLFGGGLSLAEAVKTSGLAEWIAGAMGGVEVPVLAMVILVTTVTLFLTELTSNTATAAAFLPLIASVALGLGENPLLLAIPAALAATCAFMLPVGTPPNAIVYGSGQVTIAQMVRAGWALNLMFIVAIVVLVYTLAMPVFGLEPGVVPPWARP